MSELKNRIKEIESKELVDADTRNRLLEGLGEVLIKRIGDESLPEDSGESPGIVLSEYRRLQREIATSNDRIALFEKEILHFKELEETISTREKEKLLFENELEEVHVQLGKVLFMNIGSSEMDEPLKEKKENLIAKIEENEKKLEVLDEQKAGPLAWIGKNAQIAVSKASLAKDRSTLKKLYHKAGENYTPDEDVTETSEALGAETTSVPGRAFELRKLLSELSTDLSSLREERKKNLDYFGLEGTPAKRILVQEKHITHISGQLHSVYLRMGILAEGKKEDLLSFIKDEDATVLDKAAQIKSSIADGELMVKKIKTTIRIGEEKAEVERLEQEISNQQRKIAAAEEAITGLEKQIAETEFGINEMNMFIETNGGIPESYGSKD